MKINKNHEKKREQFDELCETAATKESIIDALIAASDEKDMLIEQLMSRLDYIQGLLDRCEAKLSSALSWRDCYYG